MVAVVEISTALLAAIVADATFDPAVERCGLLFGGTDRIDAFQLVQNVAVSPSDAFELDPAALLAAHRTMRDGGARIVGHYHSHPSGRAWPSSRDAASSAGDGQLWLIVAGRDAGLFRAVPSGPIAGAFEAVTLRPLHPSA